MPVTDYSSTYATDPAKKLPIGMGGSFDGGEALLLDATAVTADGQSTAQDVEGGGFVEWVTRVGAVTGTSPTLLESLQVSIDGGTTYFKLITLPSLDSGDANQWISRTAYLPRGNASNKLIKVRLDHDVGGTTPSFTLTSFLRGLGLGMDVGLEYLT